MTQVDLIRKAFFEEGLNVSELAERFSHDRKTIRKYLETEDWNEPVPVQAVESMRKFPKLEPYMKDIDEWLEEDKRARRKQRHTARRVFDRLRSKYGIRFDCSYRTVAAYVAIRKKELFGQNKGRLPLQHAPGEAQADFGEADFYENGVKYSLSAVRRHGKCLKPLWHLGFRHLWITYRVPTLFVPWEAKYPIFSGVPAI
ncbi:IS21 transposase-type HTH domain protein [Acididesulfobacillus acetoxydans]|uniref:IS21 transposase-type HTH domain profile n=1 Tax=Acididesulfobacillus acetoxydans TaxID=1561005 RepID=A0A8S0X4H0_9FIRM|nr:IS21 transposase-type HTH domain protein [Acididesulfobacillus acetoxydans]CEJ08618.1 IS21 transposase-type HTH domain profile [Acididesulfobacillus acetoxydans]